LTRARAARKVCLMSSSKVFIGVCHVGHTGERHNGRPLLDFFGDIADAILPAFADGAFPDYIVMNDQVLAEFVFGYRAFNVPEFAEALGARGIKCKD
jgi:hypothetical protein